MSLYKDASLVMIPSAYKDGKLYSIRPTDGSGDFTFTRCGGAAGCDLGATRVDVNGLIEKGRENLLLQSNQFDTTWTMNANASVTSGQSGYDETNDAWLLSTIGSQYASARQTIATSGVITASFYAKANTLDFIVVSINGNTASYQFFDLANGVVGTNLYGNEVDATIVSVGNGWYRCSLTFNDNNIVSARVYPVGADNTFTTTAGSVYIQDAQLEAGLVATDYIETGASTAQAGILEDMPRLDYSGSCPALLLEPQRTNILADSEYFGGSYYVKGSGVSVVDNNYTSPEGLINGAKLIGATGTSRNGSVLTRVVSVSSSTTYTASIYVYKDTATQCTLYLRDGSTGIVIPKNVTLENGWQRIENSLTTGASTNQMNWYLGNTDGDIGIYGAQLEAASYPTSYIPTYGSSVTRSGDNPQLTDYVSKGLISDATEWTIFVEVDSLYETGNVTASQFIKGQGSTLDVYASAAPSTDGEVARFYWRKDGTYLSSDFGTKIIARLSNGVGTDFQDGLQSGTGAITGDYSSIGYTTPFAVSTAGRIKQILIFNTALTDSECIALTTL